MRPLSTHHPLSPLLPSCQMPFSLLALVTPKLRNGSKAIVWFGVHVKTKHTAASAMTSAKTVSTAAVDATPASTHAACTRSRSFVLSLSALKPFAPSSSVASLRSCTLTVASCTRHQATAEKQAWCITLTWISSFAVYLVNRPNTSP